MLVILQHVLTAANTRRTTLVWVIIRIYLAMTTLDTEGQPLATLLSLSEVSGNPGFEGEMNHTGMTRGNPQVPIGLCIGYLTESSSGIVRYSS